MKRTDGGDASPDGGLAEAVDEGTLDGDQSNTLFNNTLAEMRAWVAVLEAEQDKAKEETLGAAGNIAGCIC